MIGFFPEIYPDELVFSACSRYHERAGYRSREATGRDLFGKGRAKVAIDFPCNLEALVNSSPWRDWKTVDRLIDEHTLLTFFGPFVPPKRLDRLRLDMRGDNGGSVHGRLGVLTSGTGGENLRFCPQCAEDDRAKYDGETYWHRSHQLPGVEVCHTHEVFLEDTPVHARNRAYRDAFVTAGQAIGGVPPRAVDHSNQDHRVHLRIARDAAWLLEQRGLVAEAAGHRDRYLGLLYEKGFSSYSGPVNTASLIEALKGYYSKDLLERLGCGLDRKYNWVHRLVHNRARSQNPIQHLLMMQFLSVRVCDFFRLPMVRPPFGEGPWPCLNRASKHFGESVISEYELAHTQNLRRPKGIFRCSCGFTYYRVGPDESSEARYKADGLVTAGLAWEKALAEAYKKSNPLNELAKNFCLTAEMVGHLLVRLGLIASSDKSGEVATILSCGNRGKRTKGAQYLELLKARRELWLEAVKTNPDAGRHALRRKYSFLYEWFSKNDREWFQARLPPRKPATGPGVLVNWPQRDTDTVKAIKGEVERIRSAPGKPVRVTGTGVAKNIGKLSVVNKRGNLLPLTVKALAEVTESNEDYAVRRVLWATDCFRAEGILPSVWQLQLRAGVSNKVSKHPVVKAAMEAAIESLDPKSFVARNERT